MKMSAQLRVASAIFAIGLTLVPPRRAIAQEAAIAEALADQAAKVLGRETFEGASSAALKPAFAKMLADVGAEGPIALKAAESQLQRVVASSDRDLIGSLENLPSRSLPLLENVEDAGLRNAVGTLSRPGVAEIVEVIPAATRQAAIAGEARLPGAGAKLVLHYGEDGARLSQSLTQDQANGLLSVARPRAVNALAPGERTKFLNALSTRPEARVFNLEGINGPLMVVAGGVVLWHASDIALTADERVTERPDGTVVRERVGAAAAIANSALDMFRIPLIIAAIAFSAACAFIVVSRQRLRKRVAHMLPNS